MADVLAMNDAPAEARASWRSKKQVSESARLRTDLTKAHACLDEALALVKTHFEALTDRDRRALPRPHEPFASGARRLVEAVETHPELAVAARFDAQTVLELLDEVESAASLAPKAEELLRYLSDGKLAWLAEAYDSSRALYGMAKAGARSDGALRGVVEALAPAFAFRRRSGAKAAKA